MNSIGHIFRLTTFGESHGPALGGIIDGMPAGIHIDLDLLHRQMARRRPGQSAIVTPRRESDEVELLSGILHGVTTGTPVGFIIRNENQHSADYSQMEHTLRPSHADYTYLAKYGLRDHRGGGRASARETAARVVAGALAAQALSAIGVKVFAYTSQVGTIRLSGTYRDIDLGTIDSNPVRCPDPAIASEMENLILQVKSDGDTIGGVITCVATGVPPGIGSPLFAKLQADLAAAMMGIPAAKGFEYGMGFEGSGHRGSEMIDEFTSDDRRRIRTRTNHSGGIQGGITNGQDIYMRIAFKPVATLLREVGTITDAGEPTLLKARGRHDPCVVPRAVPVVEAMAAITLLDHILMNQTVRLNPPQR